MDDFHKLSHSVKDIQDVINDIQKQSGKLSEDIDNETKNLDELADKVSRLLSEFDFSVDFQEDETLIEINRILDDTFFTLEEKTQTDAIFDLNKADILLSCIAGGLAVLVDFLIVRVPKDMNIKLDGEKVYHEGSPLTAILRKIGLSEDGKESKWIQTLEKWFHVNYDPSIKDNIPGMYPKNHRVYSLGHDPSIIGLIWGIRDIICGTFSYIDKNGVLHIDKVAPSDFKKILYAPILWLGHIVSDIFTKQGIPIPGTSVLRMLKFGSLGEKDRTIGELVEYMYVQGYDLRHLATMSVCRIVIGITVNIYCYLISDIKVDISQPLFEREHIRVKKEMKKRKMMFMAYSIAVAGNIGKVAAYQGSPFAINIAIWYQFTREAISQVIMHTNDSVKFMETIENRHLIDETFEKLLMLSE